MGAIDGYQARQNLPPYYGIVIGFYKPRKSDLGAASKRGNSTSN
jgi:hypothetical protein